MCDTRVGARCRAAVVHRHDQPAGWLERQLRAGKLQGLTGQDMLGCVVRMYVPGPAEAQRQGSVANRTRLASWAAGAPTACRWVVNLWGACRRCASLSP
jgi:hypothetical protein